MLKTTRVLFIQCNLCLQQNRKRHRKCINGESHPRGPRSPRAELYADVELISSPNLSGSLRTVHATLGCRGSYGCVHERLAFRRAENPSHVMTLYSMLSAEAGLYLIGIKEPFRLADAEHLM